MTKQTLAVQFKITSL